MLHYHVWFHFKAGVGERDGVGVIRSFLQQLLAAGKIGGFRVLKNTAKPPETVLAPYDALIEFADEAQFAAAFDELRKIGIHTEPHGTIIKTVEGFSADVFEEVR